MQEQHRKAGNAMVSSGMPKTGDDIKGMVFDIQRYSIHDGPGIRTLVFLKGCPLNCQWCSNPESWDTAPQLFYRQSKCIHCGNCAKESPNGSISIDEEGKLSVDFAVLNSGDLSWVNKTCPAGALSVKGTLISAGDVFSIIMKDEIYYRMSGGGITLSGGEPLMQEKFTRDILLKARQNTISAAVETSGCVNTDALLSVIHNVDLFLYDFKIFDDNKHRHYTGCGNLIIKDNLKALAARGANILVRMPLIPGINDDDENLEQTLEFLRSAGIRRFTVLPYHQYGSGKYQSTGRPYGLQHINPPQDDALSKVREKIADSGFSPN